MADVVRRRVRVYGAVQGVFFRDSCRREASRLGVTGWVRNRSDGSVEAAFEGSDDAVEQMCQWCRSGPPHASVENVEIAAEDPVGDRGFRVED